MITDKLKLKGRVAFELRDKDGNLKESRKIDNLVVDTGLDFIASRIAGASSNVMSHMALGSGTTAAAAGDTDVESILGSREALDSTSVTDNEVVFIASFGAGSGTGAVTEAGLFNAATSGDMLCRTVFSVINKSADDSLTVNWTVSVSAS